MLMKLKLTDVSRVIYGLPFAVFGIMHFQFAESMAGAVLLPGGIFWVYLSGVALIGATVAIVFNIKVKEVSLLLGILILIILSTVHLVSLINSPNPMITQNALSNLLKDIALCGAAFYISATYYEKEKSVDSSATH